MRELPRVNIYEDFYIWFDLEEKKEHYATPLYLYQVTRDRIKPDDETKLYLKLEKDISKVKTGKDKKVIRHPSTIYIHYVENLGAMLINFLNADFTNYETVYNTFFYAYGYELVKDYAPYSYLKNDEHITDVQFKKIIKDIFETGSDRFIEWQDNFRKCVDFVYNLNGNEDLKNEENKLAKFVAYTIKDSEFYTYSQDIEVITDNYINIHNYNHNEIYCDLANVDQSPSCKEKGANEQYKKNLENNQTQALYRRIYRQKFMIAQRNKESKKIQKDFEQWKKEAKDKINKMKKNKLTEDEVYKWLVENK